MGETQLGNALRGAADTIEDVGDIVINDYYDEVYGAEMFGEICWDLSSTIRQIAVLLDANITKSKEETD